MNYNYYTTIMSGFVAGGGRGGYITPTYDVPDELKERVDEHSKSRDMIISSFNQDGPELTTAEMLNMKARYYAQFDDDNVYFPRVASGIFWGLMSLGNVAAGISWFAAPFVAIPVTLIGSALAYTITYSERDPDQFICIACKYRLFNPHKTEDEVFDYAYQRVKEYYDISDKLYQQCKLYQYDYD